MDRGSGGRGLAWLGPWLSRQLAGARSGLVEEYMYAAGKGGRDLRDLQSAHPLHNVVPRHAEFISTAPWRVRMGHALESHQAHMVIMALVVFDLIAVFGEVMLTNVCGIERDKAEERLANESGADALDALHREERIHAWEGGLHRFSIAIVIALLVYVLGLAVSFGPKFFTKVWCVLAAAVLSVTRALEFSLANDSSGFLPLILSWRVVRIAHGFIVTEESPATEVAKLRRRIDASRAQAAWDASDDIPALHRRLEAISAIVCEAADDDAGAIDAGFGPAAAADTPASPLDSEIASAPSAPQSPGPVAADSNRPSDSGGATPLVAISVADLDDNNAVLASGVRPLAT